MKLKQIQWTETTYRVNIAEYGQHLQGKIDAVPGITFKIYPRDPTAPVFDYPYGACVSGLPDQFFNSDYLMEEVELGGITHGVIHKSIAAQTIEDLKAVLQLYLERWMRRFYEGTPSEPERAKSRYDLIQDDT